MTVCLHEVKGAHVIVQTRQHTHTFNRLNGDMSPQIELPA